jgi:hypothetical protein
MLINVHLRSDCMHVAGAIPIPGAKNIDQAAMNAGALNLQLTPLEVQVSSLKVECARIEYFYCSEGPGSARKEARESGRLKSTGTTAACHSDALMQSSDTSSADAVERHGADFLWYAQELSALGRQGSLSNWQHG